MRPNKYVGLENLDCAVPEATAKIYDFGVRKTDTSRRDCISVLEHENKLLTRLVSETRTEILRLRKLLTIN